MTMVLAYYEPTTLNTLNSHYLHKWSTLTWFVSPRSLVRVFPPIPRLYSYVHAEPAGPGHNFEIGSPGLRHVVTRYTGVPLAVGEPPPPPATCPPVDNLRQTFCCMFLSAPDNWQGYFILLRSLFLWR